MALILVGFHCGTAESKAPQISLTNSHRHVPLAHGCVNEIYVTAVGDFGNHGRKRILTAEGKGTTRPWTGLQASSGHGIHQLSSHAKGGLTAKSDGCRHEAQPVSGEGGGAIGNSSGV